MPSAQYFLRLKTAGQAAYQRALEGREVLRSGNCLLKRGTSLANISFPYPYCRDVLSLSQKSLRLPATCSALGDSSPLSLRVELRDLCRFDQPNRFSVRSTDQGKALSMSGALSRTFAIPSVSGPSWQTCEYHTHLLVDRSQPSSSKFSPSMLTVGKLLGKVAHQSCIKAGSEFSIGQPEGYRSSVRHSLNSKSSSQCCGLHKNDGLRRSLQIVYYHNIRGDGCYSGDRERPEKRDLGRGNLPDGSLVLYISKSGSGFPWVGRSEAKHFHDSTAFLNSARAAPDITFDGSSKDDTLDDSQTASDQALLGDRVLKLSSGACYLPHPDKEETGGEDAHFICAAEQAIGVADGVGGWAQMGVNSGEYARELMAQSVVAIHEEPRGSIDPARVLEKAYLSTKSRGSSTACILALSDQDLHAVNLGDSGFLVVRDGCTVFRSPVQQHDFNFTFQLESGDGSDLPSSAQVFTLQVAPGDVIIAGTDGLFDNLYNSEVTAVVVHAVRAGLGPQITAQKIAALARQRAQDRHRQTPFSTAAQDAGFRYYGGKLDDITVVVSYVTTEEIQA